jgi:predicted esterase
MSIEIREIVSTIETPTHGRYLVRLPDAPGPWPLLIGFHGYAEDAAIHLRELSRIPGSEKWLIVSVQALHRFYTKDSRVVASWMTREDREHAIADNVEYARRVLDAVRAAHRTRGPVVWAGFSQGGAMAFRAAAHHGGAGAIILGADVPPDVAHGSRAPIPRVLLGRGTEDAWYSPEQHAEDEATLRTLGVAVEACVFTGGHEWTDAFRQAAGRLLDELSSGPATVDSTIRA